MPARGAGTAVTLPGLHTLPRRDAAGIPDDLPEIARIGKASPVNGTRLSDDHSLRGGARMRYDESGSRFFVSCRCGWESEPCLTAVLADAAGEQHLQLQAMAARRRRF